MLGKEMMYEISTCEMQYDANNKETDKKIHASYTLEGMVSKMSLSQMICDGIHKSCQQYLH